MWIPTLATLLQRNYLPAGERGGLCFGARLNRTLKVLPVVLLVEYHAPTPDVIPRIFPSLCFYPG